MRHREILRISFLGLLLATSCSVRMPVSTGTIQSSKLPEKQIQEQQPKQDTVTVYLLADTLHTTLALPYDWLVESGYKSPPNVKFEKGPLRYVIMSWGDRTAYVQRRWLTPLEVFHALFLPSPSVTEFIPISWKIEEVCYQQRIYKAEIPRSRGKHLAQFLNAGAKLNDKQQPEIIAESSWGNGYLLDCNYSYYFPRICNVWTAQCMEACGLEMNIRKAIFADSLIRQCTKQGFEKCNDGHANEGYGRKNKP